MLEELLTGLTLSEFPGQFGDGAKTSFQKMSPKSPVGYADDAAAFRGNLP